MTRIRQTDTITYNRRVPATANGGAVAVSYSYDSWGNLTADAAGRVPPALRFAWQGREYSRATALYSFRARWYDPASGRWLSKDPIGLEGGLNLYEAFGNNPVCFRDPEGNFAFNFGFSFAAGGGSGIAFSFGLVAGTSKDGGFKFGGFVTGATGAVVGLGVAATIIGGERKAISKCSGDRLRYPAEPQPFHICSRKEFLWLQPWRWRGYSRRIVKTVRGIYRQTRTL